MNPAAALIATLLGAALLTSCDGSDSKKIKAAAAGSVKIVALSPEATVPLKVGAKVKLQVQVSYRLAADSGAVGVVVQADNANLAQKVETVRKGSGTKTVTAEFVVPDTRAIQVYAPLQAKGYTATVTVDFREYKVAP